MDVVHGFPRSRSEQSTSGSASRALEDLRYIRQCVENAGCFTGVPGLGCVLVGLTALVASLVASQQASSEAWVNTWIVEAFIALGVGVAFMVRKARTLGASLSRGPGRRFALSLLPSAVAAAVITVALGHFGYYGVVPGLWLLLYGTSVITGGAFSTRVVTWMGASFMAVGMVALFVPARDLFMAVGFGGLHILFGLIIRRRHGG